MKDPDHYEQGMKNRLFNKKIFIVWVTSGALQAFVNGYLAFLMLEKTAMTESGQMSDIFLTGSIVLGFSVYNSTFKVILFSNTYSIGIITFLVGSVGIYLLSFELISGL